MTVAVLLFCRVGGGFAEPTRPCENHGSITKVCRRWWVPQSLHPPYKRRRRKAKYFAKSTYVLTPFAIQINAGVDAREGFGHVSATECNSLQHKQKDVSSVWSDKRQERMSQKARNVTPQKDVFGATLARCPQMSANVRARKKIVFGDLDPGIPAFRSHSVG